MIIAFGFEIALRLEAETAVLFCLNVHPSRAGDLISGEDFRVEPNFLVDEYLDAYGNRCGRFRGGPGVVRFVNEGLIRDCGELDPFVPRARPEEITRLPHEAMAHLLPSRYCESDSELANFAWEQFGKMRPGWARVQAICDFVHQHIEFDT